MPLVVLELADWELRRMRLFGQDNPFAAQHGATLFDDVRVKDLGQQGREPPLQLDSALILPLTGYTILIIVDLTG